MNIQDFDNVQIIKLLLQDKKTTQKILSEELMVRANNFSEKIHKNNLKVTDLQRICDILGYELTLKEK